jgi:hypothetical protein
VSRQFEAPIGIFYQRAHRYSIDMSAARTPPEDGREQPARTTADKLLVILLRYVLGIPGLLALVAVFMPMSWMAAAHRRLGLGEMPDAPIVEYLARSLSAFYALLGALCLLAASDLERYRPLARCLGIALALLGLALLGVDIAADLPPWWIALEGPRGIGLGALVYFLARPTYRGKCADWPAR